jgi:hypothetical protein
MISSGAEEGRLREKTVSRRGPVRRRGLLLYAGHVPVLGGESPLRSRGSGPSSEGKRLTVSGVAKTTTEWAEEVGIKRSTITERLRRGWGEEAAVLTPSQRLLRRNQTPRRSKVQYVPVEKEQGVEGNVLGGDGDPPFDCQMGEIATDLRSAASC